MPDLDLQPLERETGAVVDTIRQPVVAAFQHAAERLSPLNAADLKGLERMARLHLDAIRASLRAQQLAEMQRLTAARARWQDLDLPQAMRRDVYGQRTAVAQDSAP